MKIQSRSRMTKSINIFLLMLAFSFVCSPANPEDNKFQEKVKNAKAYKEGTNLAIVIMSISNISKQDADYVGYDSYSFYKDTGKTDSVVQIWLKNLSDRVIEVNPLHFKLTTENGYTLSLSDYTFRTRNPFPNTALEPGTKAEGMVVFGRSMNDKPVKLIYDDSLGNRVSRNFDDAMILYFERDFKKMGIK